MRYLGLVNPMRILLVTAFVVAGTQAASAQLTITGQFDPSASSDNCGLGFDSSADEVWVYGCSGSIVQRYSAAGVPLSSVPRPGESANDVDVELSTRSFKLGATVLPANALLFINGETGPADIYAVDKTTGAVLSTLNTTFGVSHVVGGAYHRQRQTLFLVQDRVPGAADENRIAEINTATGAVVNTFQISSTFSVNFGDLEVCNSTGNLIVVSSDETEIAEYTPTGTLVQNQALPVGVTELAGIGIDDSTGDLWVASSAAGGDVWRLSGGPCGAAPVSVPALSGHGPFVLVGLLMAVSLASSRPLRRIVAGKRASA